jgi:hypothetical protein
MIKLVIGIGILLFGGFIWLRSQWARSKNSGAAKQIINDLQSGKYVIESYAESLGILICSKPLPEKTNLAIVKQLLQSLKGKPLQNKFNIQYADMNQNGKGIIIAEAKAKDIVPLYNSNKEIDIHFPCWLYIDTDEANNKVDFKSTFPESKDHHYLLEDFAVEIYDQCIKNNKA